MPQRRLLLLPQLQSLLWSMQWQRWRLNSQLLLLLLLSPAMRAGAQLLVQCHAAMMQMRTVGAAAPAGAAPAAAAVARSLLQQHPQSLPLHLRVAAAAAEVRQQERLQMLLTLMLVQQLSQASIKTASSSQSKMLPLPPASPLLLLLSSARGQAPSLACLLPQCVSSQARGCRAATPSRSASLP
jgi:hypothetical protein